MRIVYTFYAIVLSIAFIVPSNYFGLYDTKRILQLLLILFVIIYFTYDVYLDDGHGDNLNLSKRFCALLLLLFFIGLASSVGSDNINYAFFDVTFKLLLVCTLLLITPTTKVDNIFVKKIIFISSFIFVFLYSSVFIINYIDSFFDIQKAIWPNKFVNINIDGELIKIHFQNKDLVYFANKRIFNHVQTFTIPLLLGLYVYAKNRLSITLSWVVIVFLSIWWMLLFASNARGSLVGVIVGFILLSIIFKEELKIIVKPFFSSIIVGTLLTLLFFYVIPGSSPDGNVIRTSSSGRYEIWIYAFNLWLSNPIFGVGPYHFSKLNDVVDIATTHNLPLTILAEWGIIAFFLAVLIILKIFNFIKCNLVPFWRQNNQEIYLNICVLWAFIAGLIHSLFSGIYITPLGQLWFILISAFLLGQYQNITLLNNLNFTIRKKYIYYLMILIYVLVIIQLTYCVDFELVSDSLRSYPRFWEQGKFN